MFVFNCVCDCVCAGIVQLTRHQEEGRARASRQIQQIDAVFSSRRCLMRTLLVSSAGQATESGTFK